MSESQPGLFDQSPEPAKLGSAKLVLTTKSGRVLTKAQQAFNRLVSRIEKLRAKLDRETRRLDATLAHFAREIHPRLRRQAALQTDLVRALAPLLEGRGLKGQRDRRALRDLLAMQLDEIAAAEGGLVAEDLRTLYEQLHGVSFEAAMARHFAADRETMEGMFEDLGVDIDLSDLEPDMDEADIAAKLAEKLHGASASDGGPARAQAASPARNKRQQAGEARKQAAAELRQKTIGSIYKQLAKVLHPDLEPNPAERARKVALMQELIAAHRAGDLHTLLRLELEWLHREEADARHLTEDKLAVFNRALREQAQDLELELFRLPQDPRYHALSRGTGLFPPARWTDSPSELHELDLALADMERSLAALRGPDQLNEVRALLAMWREGG